MKQIFKTTVLLGLLTSIFLMIGYAVAGQRGLYYAFGLSLLTNAASYWFSDKLVLKMQGARAVDRSEAPDLYAIVEELAAKDNVPMPKVYVVDSAVPNAFATGRSPNHAAVAANTGILDILTHDELKGVLAHELSHVKNRDILISTIAATTAGAISLVAQMAYYGGAIFGGGGNSDNGRRSSPIGSLAMMIIAPLSATLIQLSISRSREFAADESGARLLGDGEPLARALAKLRDFKEGHVITASPADQTTAHLMFVNMFSGSSVLSGLFSTHPDINERIKRLERLQQLK